MRWMAVLGVTALALAGCQGDLPPDLLRDMAENCGAEDVQNLVGQPKSVLDGMRFSQPMQLIAPGVAVTLDYLPNRLNIYLDDQGIITELQCG